MKYALEGTIKKTIPKTSEQGTNGTFDLVRIDMCGPFNIKSIEGAKYFITFIDDKCKTIMCIQPLKAFQ
jgi:hypothetical protein